ncbi:unnamed protein product [Symbiodinium sp. CCMP2456]|nr:unnamed protein product [Symbiodinium sp. CCMP2456]
MGASCCSEIDKARETQPVQVHSQPSLPPPLPGESEVPSAPKEDLQAEASVMASGGDGETQVSEMVDEVTAKEQRHQAKQVVKDFVKEMVKGRKMNVMTQAGQLKTCVVSLSRNLDALKIKVGAQNRSIALRDVDEIAAGADVEGISTPLDDLCATLVLSDDCITFRFADLNARDTFVMCLLMFCNSQK